MTISSQTRKAGPYIGAGTTSTFPFAFKVFQASDLLVVEVNTATGIETTLALTTNYTVSLNADQDNSPGGSITLVGGNLATGINLVISSQVPYTQGTDITNMGGFYPDIIENALDKLTIEAQQIREQQGRQLTYPITDPSSSTGSMPSALERAGQYLAFDANGNPIAAATLPSYIYLGPKSSDPTTRNDSSPLQTGDLYFNTITGRMRVYNAGWLDVGTAIPLTITVQRFSGDSSTTAFTLSVDPGFTNATEVFISGVAQVAGVDYTVSGTTLTFTTAPPTGTNNIYVRMSSSYSGGVPNDGSVTAAKMAAGAAVGNIGYTPANDTLAMHLAGAETATGAKRGAVVALTDGATITPDFSAGNNFSVTLGGNRALANPTNIVAGQSGVIAVAQDGTGSRTLSFGGYFKFASGAAPTLTTTASAVDLIAYYVESSTRIDARFIGDVK